MTPLRAGIWQCLHPVWHVRAGGQKTRDDPILMSGPLETAHGAHATYRETLSAMIPRATALFGWDLALLNEMPVGLAIYDLDGTLMHANPYFARLVSHPCMPSRADRTAGLWQTPTASGDETAVPDFPCERALRGETVAPGVDLLHIGHDGRCRRLNVSAAPICDPVRDIPTGIVMLFLDIDERNEAATFAARTGQGFRQFAEHSSAPTWIARAVSEAFEYRNPEHLGLTGAVLSRSATLTDWLDDVDELDRAMVRRQYDLVLQGNIQRFDYTIHRRDIVKHCRLRETSFPVHDENGKLIAIAGIAEDITPASEGYLYIVGRPADRATTLNAVINDHRLQVKTFSTLAQLLNATRFLVAGCVVVDMAATADADENIARVLEDYAATLPIVIIGRPDTDAAAAVAAMRAGAADYLITPCSNASLADAVVRATNRVKAAPGMRKPDAELPDRLASLSQRQREVMIGLAHRGTNKSIARQLGISPRTVELHRAHLMERLNVRSFAELLQAAHATQL